MILLGLCGAHRTGKTTLCHEMEKVGFEYLPISISDMQKEAGFDSSNQEYDWDTRMKIQSYILTKFRVKLLEHHHSIQTAVLRTERLVITDRTPLDLIGYTMLAFPTEPSKADTAWMQWYITQCIRLTNKFYTKVFLVQPGIPLVHSPTSGPLDMNMIETLNQCYLSQFMSPELTIPSVIIPREATDIHVRKHIIAGWDK